MLKKIFVICFIAVVSSFATWDYFPILPSGLGQIKGQFEYKDNDPMTQINADIAVRFSLTKWLEIHAIQGYLFYTHFGGNDAQIDGFKDLMLGLRFQFMSDFRIFADFIAPIGDNSFNDDVWDYYFGFQHTSFLKHITWATELGLNINADGKYYITKLGDEIDFRLGSFVPLFGTDFVLAIYDENYYRDKTQFGYDIYIGFKFALNIKIGIEASIHFQNGDYFSQSGDDPMLIRAAFSSML